MADCTKIKYPNPVAASAAMKAIVARTVDTRPKVPRAVYRCPPCQAWHLTSQKPKGKLSRRWTAAIGA